MRAAVHGMLCCLAALWSACLSEVHAERPAAGPGCVAASCEGEAPPQIAAERSVTGAALERCGTSPPTGFYRDGYCRTGPEDLGTHTVCAAVTDEFLAYTLAQGNDLITARPELRFPGLKAGDRWCLCASRWEQARRAGAAPPVILEATHEATLRHTERAHLKVAVKR